MILKAVEMIWIFLADEQTKVFQEVLADLKIYNVCPSHIISEEPSLMFSCCYSFAYIKCWVLSDLLFLAHSDCLWSNMFVVFLFVYVVFLFVFFFFSTVSYWWFYLSLTIGQSRALWPTYQTYLPDLPTFLTYLPDKKTFSLIQTLTRSVLQFLRCLWNDINELQPSYKKTPLGQEWGNGKWKCWVTRL